MSSDSHANPEPGLPIHRSEALTDGIYAVAMTLLVIELKLPEHVSLSSSEAVAHALFELAPKFFAWALSFAVLGLFWFGHYRAYAQVRRSDGRLVGLNLTQLAFVSLLPFSSALLGEHGGPQPQAVYSVNLALLSLFSLLSSRHIHAHPELSVLPMTRAAYAGARVRTLGLIVVSLGAIAIGQLLPPAWGGGAGNLAFVLMVVIMPLSRSVERRAAARAATGVTR